MSSCLNSVFGVDLTTIVKMEGGLIPNILSKCFTELQSRGFDDYNIIKFPILYNLLISDLTVQGIYRVSGQNSEIMELKDKFNQGEL